MLSLNTLLNTAVLLDMLPSAILGTRNRDDTLYSWCYHHRDNTTISLIRYTITNGPMKFIKIALARLWNRLTMVVQTLSNNHEMLTTCNLFSSNSLCFWRSQSILFFERPAEGSLCLKAKSSSFCSFNISISISPRHFFWSTSSSFALRYSFHLSTKHSFKCKLTVSSS